MEEPQQMTYIRINPHLLRIIALGAGFGLGFLIVALDPWLRFSPVPARINVREALLTAIMLAGYGGLVGWMITAFWRSWAAVLLVALTTPLVTGVLAFWNEVAAIFTNTETLILYMPIIFLLHGALVTMAFLYVAMVRHLPGRRWLVYGAVPVILIVLAFSMGRLRWANTDSKEVMLAVDTYAHGITTSGYSIEYLGIRYSRVTVAVGQARVHTQEGNWHCLVRLYPDRLETSCERETE
jgi:hypothetical protein